MALRAIWPEVPWTICYIILNTCKSVRRHVFVIVYLRQKTSWDKIRKKTLYWSDPVNIIHLLHAGEGNMKYENVFTHEYHIPLGKSIIFPEGNARGEYDTRGWINFHISWTRMLWMFYYTEWNQENTYM